MTWATNEAGVVFLITLAITYATAIYARIHSKTGHSEEDLAGRGLGRWLIGLSAGTTANSGFVVTGAVGLGYTGGIHWLFLPLSWLIGDLVYWTFFPQRLNRVAREGGATTLSELLTFDLKGVAPVLISIIAALLLATFLPAYTAAQWLAGKKFLSGAFQISDQVALIVFSITIILYSALGGFRGSVYTDFVQSLIRIFGTFIAIGAVSWFAINEPAAFSKNITSAGPAFLSPFPGTSLISAAGFILGYAGAAVGFGLGQPQVVTRYFAGSSPEEAKAAKWIYIAFVQGTWLAMTAFGVLLRGVMPNIADPETGLSIFFQRNIWAIPTGIIFADVFATIASTSNGLLVATAQTLGRDLIGRVWPSFISSAKGMTLLTLALGLLTIGLSFVLPGNVFSIAINAVSMIGAGLAGPVMIKVFHWRHNGFSLLMALVAGIAAGVGWTEAGYDNLLNPAIIGIGTGLVANGVLALFHPAAPNSKRIDSRSIAN